MKKPKPDLSRENCHCCGIPLKKDIKNMIEWCINPFCSAKGVNFSIPYLNEGDEDERD